ncbi:heme-binding protein [Halomonas sp. MCCC 1A17488]|uniref:Heme-binding protein n=1 Tax=Billgrantia sulfidoxydans TaxID=2733484 RepID=A0ABX7W8S6_9GAMM|nr:MULTISPECIES: heme-binding protein [Halomonas]MCE8017577.1 heme-binding protein [Halomonas sp. MCCC 1A17488]MCG3240910.1 heme-binding protein [Halomonas sp. MCCC 1A17488]QPP48782.1 heme-binding protein [Halomonas sp. SS10-MC5]QTP56117.1 heme-binding protein [Halomonas sulfidoxydans]
MAGKVFRSHFQLSRLQARAILDGAFAEARIREMEPLTAVVLDGGGQVVAAEREDGCAPLRFAVAQGKAYAALGNGVASAVVGERNLDRPAFLASVAAASGGRFVAVAGGVLILDELQRVIGAVGVSGASSSDDERAAVAGIAAAGLAWGLSPDPA